MPNKKFTLTLRIDGDNYTIETSNEGFTILELLGLLEAKKQDLIDQMCDKLRNKTFKRVCRMPNDEIIDIVEEKKDE